MTYPKKKIITKQHPGENTIRNLKKQQEKPFEKQIRVEGKTRQFHEGANTDPSLGLTGVRGLRQTDTPTATFGPDHGARSEPEMLSSKEEEEKREEDREGRGGEERERGEGE